MYRIYGKKKVAKRFQAFDATNGCLVSKLIHATVYTADQLRGLRREVEYMNDHNADYVFTIKKAG